jgi:hypothetical protein
VADISIWQKTGHFYFALTLQKKDGTQLNAWECLLTGNPPIKRGIGPIQAVMFFEINAFWRDSDGNFSQAVGIEITGGDVFLPEPCPPPGIHRPPSSR